MTRLLRNTALAGLAALTLGAGMTGPAAAQWRGGGYGWGGGPVAAGVVGGLALGAIAGGAIAGGAYPRYYGYGPAYYPGGCRLQRQATYDPYGNFLGYRRVRVCY